MTSLLIGVAVAAATLCTAAGVSSSSAEQDRQTVAALDTVRVWGDTAVVTARLWLKGVNDGVAFDRRLWFSDTYVRTPNGWRYAFGQASLKLPDEPPAS